MKRLFLMFLATVSLIACNEGGNDTPKPIELMGGTQTTQTIYADETEKSEGIKFKATAEWTAAVTDVTSRANDKEGWLRLSAYSGGAGDVTLTISLDQNDTGKDRKAEIRITCGGTTITITVEQKATNKPEDPETPDFDKLITKIEKIDNRTDGVRGSQLNEFFYDNSNRVNKIVVTETEIEGVGSAEKTTTWISTGVITYTSNTVSYNWTRTENGASYSDGMGNGEITLDNNGRAISGKGSYIEEKPQIEETKYTYSLEYNDDGYLAKSEIVRGYKPDETQVEKLTWTNGNLTQVWWGENPYENKDMIDKAIYGSVPNKTNLDLNWFHATGLPETEGFAFACGDSQNIFSLLGYVGKRAKNLVEQLSDGYNGKTDFTVKNSYTVDADGYPIMIEQSNKRYIGGPENNQSFEWVKGMPYKITYNK